MSQEEISAVSNFLIQLLRSASPLGADEIIARAQKNGYSAASVSWAIWNLVGDGVAEVTDDSRVTALLIETTRSPAPSQRHRAKRRSPDSATNSDHPPGSPSP